MKTQKELSQIRSRCFIKPYEGGDWQDLGEVVKGAISIEERIPDAIEVSNFGPIKITFKVSVDLKKIRKALLKLMGKPRKTTYKTIRQDCAKRNRI